MTTNNVMMVPPLVHSTMNEPTKRHLGEQVEPGGRPKAPGRLALLQRFINTWNHDFPAEWDRLGTPEDATAWLAVSGLGAPTCISADDAATLRELREALRALVVANQRDGTGPDPAAVRTVQAAARQAALWVAVDADGRTVLQPVHGDLRGAVATLLGIIHEAQLTGAWWRLKGCRQCGYAFYDRSKNRSAAWCAMAICGNRAKNRTYRRRKPTAAKQRHAAPPT
jgi:predicted RNA-binding Zn ribbon-like protein